jgi:hypothetical protein
MLPTKFWFIWPSGYRSVDKHGRQRQFLFLIDWFLKKILLPIFLMKVLCTKFDICSFLAHLANGNVSFCHHLASVVCCPLTFLILIFSSETLAIFIKDFPRMLPTKFRFIWPSGFRGDNFFRNQPIRNKNCLWRPYLLMDRDEMSSPYRGSAIDTS